MATRFFGFAKKGDDRYAYLSSGVGSLVTEKITIADASEIEGNVIELKYSDDKHVVCVYLNGTLKTATTHYIIDSDNNLKFDNSITLSDEDEITISYICL